MHKTFDTPTPTSLHVELGSGRLTVQATDATETTVDVTGKDADDVTVEMRGGQIVVLSPPRKAGFFTGSSSLSVDVTLPEDSALSTKLGSADVRVTGRLGDTTLKSGSGDVRLDQVVGDTLVESGSGDIEIDSVTGDLKVRTGSGEVGIAHVSGAAVISTGSGDVTLGTVEGEVSVKSGSGGLRVTESRSDLSLTTASGDLSIGTLHRGAVRAKNVSGDIRVGIPAGVPVWTDISCVSGTVRSSLQGAGQPADGQDHIELRARTISGDISLQQL